MIKIEGNGISLKPGLRIRLDPVFLGHPDPGKKPRSWAGSLVHNRNPEIYLYFSRYIWLKHLVTLSRILIRISKTGSGTLSETLTFTGFDCFGVGPAAPVRWRRALVPRRRGHSVLCHFRGQLDQIFILIFTCFCKAFYHLISNQFVFQNCFQPYIYSFCKSQFLLKLCFNICALSFFDLLLKCCSV